MALAFDDATDGGHNFGSYDSHTFAHTVTGTNPILWVAFAGDASGGADDVTSVTYNSVAMTLAVKKVGATDQDRNIYLYVLPNPSTGTHDVVIQCATVHYILGGAASYTGADSSGQPDSVTTNIAATISDTSLTTSVTPLGTGCWGIVVAGCSSAVTPTAGAGLTRRAFEGTYNTWAIFDTNGTISGATSLTTNQSSPSFVKIVHTAATFVPVGGGAVGGSVVPVIMNQFRQRRA